MDGKNCFCILHEWLGCAAVFVWLRKCLFIQNILSEADGNNAYGISFPFEKSQ